MAASPATATAAEAAPQLPAPDPILQLPLWTTPASAELPVHALPVAGCGPWAPAFAMRAPTGVGAHPFPCDAQPAGPAKAGHPASQPAGAGAPAAAAAAAAAGPAAVAHGPAAMNTYGPLATQSAGSAAALAAAGAQQHSTDNQAGNRFAPPADGAGSPARGAAINAQQAKLEGPAPRASLGTSAGPCQALVFTTQPGETWLGQLDAAGASVQQQLAPLWRTASREAGARLSGGNGTSSHASQREAAADAGQQAAAFMSRDRLHHHPEQAAPEHRQEEEEEEEQEEVEEEEEEELEDEDEEALTCSHCGTDSTSRWERHPDTGQQLCRACRAYMRDHGGEEKPLGVRCLQCGSGSPGPRSNWRRHPTTSEGWLCSPCFRAAKHETSRASQQLGADEPSQQSQRQEEEEEQKALKCSNCGTDSVSSWERHPTTGQRLCHACRHYMRKHNGEDRPVGVHCLLCSSDSPGTGVGMHGAWRPHPSTGERWMCSPCFFAAKRQTKQASGQQEGRQLEGQGRGHDGQQAGRRGTSQPERRCRECHASSPGHSKDAGWRQHPAAGVAVRGLFQRGCAAAARATA